MASDNRSSVANGCGQKNMCLRLWPSAWSNPAEDLSILCSAPKSSFNTQYSHSPGSIASTEYSIQVGVRTLKSLLDLVGCNGLYDTDHLYLALQCYNFGPGFYDYCNKYYGGKYTEQAAQQFSLKCERNGLEVYGNPNYVNRIKDYLDIEKAAEYGRK